MMFKDLLSNNAERFINQHLNMAPTESESAVRSNSLSTKREFKKLQNYFSVTITTVAHLISYFLKPVLHTYW